MSERKSMDSVSHGRGGTSLPTPPPGAGNIGADDTPYVDGEIVREGEVGPHGDGAYSSGRGGAANIGSPGLKATARNDRDCIPAEALRPTEDTNHHVGRGGQGNVHAPNPEGAKTHPTGLADKLKAKLFGKGAGAA